MAFGRLFPSVVRAGAAGRGGHGAGNSRPIYSTPLATGVRRHPVGDSIDLGSMPMGMALAPEKGKLVVVLSGWREQGLQVVDLKSMRVTQTLQQEAAFYGVVFSRTGGRFTSREGTTIRSSVMPGPTARRPSSENHLGKTEGGQNGFSLSGRYRGFARRTIALRRRKRGRHPGGRRSRRLRRSSSASRQTTILMPSKLPRTVRSMCLHGAATRSLRFARAVTAL